MNFSQLECFESLANTLNFVKTAEQLGLSQPAVSKQIKALEEELGLTLFKRTSRSVTLSSEGVAFLHQARDLLRLYYETLKRVKSQTLGLEHKIRIGYYDPNLLPLLSTLLLSFQKKEGIDLSVQLVQGQTDENLSRLKKSQIDILLSMRDARFDDSEIIFRKLRDNSFYCIFSKEHDLARRYLDENLVAVSEKMLFSYRQILAIPPYLLKNFYSRGAKILPVNDALDNIVCETVAEAYALVAANLGYAMVPKFLLNKDDKVIALPFLESAHAPFGMYYQKNRLEHPVLRAFLNCVIAYYDNSEVLC